MTYRGSMVNKGSVYPHLKEYEELLAFWQNQAYEPLQVDYWYYMKFNPVLSKFLEHSPCVSWIFNLRTQQFDFVSKNTKEVLGYAPELFKEKGLEFCNQIKHPEDLCKTWKLLKEVWGHMIAIPPAEREHHKFNYDYRILKPNGEEVRILEQNAILQQDCKGNITHILAICNDITNWKKCNKQVATITSNLQENIIFLTSDDTPHATKTILSKRELEVIRLLAQGLSSKCIAGKLFISVHTVNTHRQNMIYKTGTKNTSELINFAKSHGLI